MWLLLYLALIAPLGVMAQAIPRIRADDRYWPIGDSRSHEESASWTAENSCILDSKDIEGGNLNIFRLNPKQL